MKKWLVAVCVMIIMITGCGKQNQVPGDTGKPVEEGVNVPSDSVSEGEKQGQSNADSDTGFIEQEETVVYEISEEKLIVTYEGEKYTTMTMGVGGDWIYVSGRAAETDEAFLGRIAKGQATLEKITLEGMESMRAFRISVEQSGVCHVLWMGMKETKENGQIISQMDMSRACITSINQDGSLKEKIDISDMMAEKKVVPYHFVADKEGNFYLDSRNTIIKIGDGGQAITVIECDGTVECLGVGRSGVVYCTYYAEDGITYLGKVEGDKVAKCEAELPQLNAKFAVMAAGVNTELLLYNRVGGAYAFDGKAQVQESITNDKLPASGESVLGSGFMNDGRLCLAAQKEGLTFYYIPVEDAEK